MSLEDVERGIQHSFAERGLLRLALTHPSHGYPNNQRLEFLGDAVLQVCVSDMLYHAMPDSNEGNLTRKRALIVQERALCAIAAQLNLGDALILGRGEQLSGGEKRASILADTVEAIIGAVYLDAGYDKAIRVVRHVIGLVRREDWLDHKTRLQEISQAIGLGRPEYEVISEEGPPHARVFSILVRLQDEDLAKGAGTSKKNAEQDAARNALKLARFSNVQL